MQPKVLGISASPQRGVKVDTLVQEVLSATRLPHELVRLHALALRPCRACHACRTENVCPLDDDWNDLSHKIREAHALVIGGWAVAGMLDAATKILMERFWSLRHHQQLARGKVGAAVVVGANPELAGTLAEALLQFMRNNGMNPLGRVTAAGANPCLGCQDALGVRIQRGGYAVWVAGAGRRQHVQPHRAPAGRLEVRPDPRAAGRAQGPASAGPGRRRGLRSGRRGIHREGLTMTARRDRALVPDVSRLPPDPLTRNVKAQARALGAHLVGVAPMDRMEVAPPNSTHAGCSRKRRP